MTCATGARWVVEGELFSSWNQPEITSAKHIPFPDSGHCRVGHEDSLALGERKSY